MRDEVQDAEDAKVRTGCVLALILMTICLLALVPFFDELLREPNPWHDELEEVGQ